jgi:hypothetical protein
VIVGEVRAAMSARRPSFRLVGPEGPEDPSLLKMKPGATPMSQDDANYLLKKAKIAAESQPKYLEVANEVYTDIRDDIVGETKNILSTIKKILTPDFIYRIQQRKVHQDAINKSVE